VSPGARRYLGPGLLLLVLGVALLIGSGVFDTPAPAAATRIAALERVVRCPSCQDLSVAQSNAASSIAVRREIAASVHAGATDQEILNTLTARYGPSILLVPPAGALSTALWVAPIVLGAGLAVTIAVVAVRRRRAA
jgi:cytochrome c-type biogenesis protein CcmH